MRLISELTEGEQIVSYSQLRSKQVKLKKDGHPYLRLVLSDRSGHIEAKIWDNVPSYRSLLKEGDFVRYQGVVQRYNGSNQLVIDQMRPVEEADRRNGFNLKDLIPTTEHDVDQMWRRLRDLARQHIKRPQVLQLVEALLDRYEEPFKSFPAGTEVHHSYWGGFLEHVLSVLESALYFCGKYPNLDGDLLLSGAILHDIGKLAELSGPANPAYTVQGNLIGHIVLGRDMVREQARHIPGFPPTFLTLLEHLILSHQGQPEWGSPQRPKLPEALVLHYVDDLDAKMNRVYRVLREDQGDSPFTSYDRFLERVIFKGPYEDSAPESARVARLFE